MEKKYENVRPRNGGPRSLYCYSCHSWIPNTANYEVKKEGVYCYSHSCEDGIICGHNGEIPATEAEKESEDAVLCENAKYKIGIINNDK